MDFVQIEGWSKPRAIGIRQSESRLVLQVKLSMCKDCDACERRHQELRARFTARGIDARWEHEGEIVSLPIPLCHTHEEKVAFLNDLLGRSVRFMKLVPV